jgi:hypothetical protein
MKFNMFITIALINEAAAAGDLNELRRIGKRIKSHSGHMSKDKAFALLGLVDTVTQLVLTSSK